MVTTEAIRELRRRTSVSSLDAMQALSASEGDLERAITFLQTPHASIKVLQVAGSHRSARLAASLIGSGLWFQCDQLGRELWRFSVAPAGYGRLLSLHAALDGSCCIDERATDPAALQRTPCEGAKC
jgi:hypothetical protein